MRGAVYVNGTITPADAAVIPVFDHGFVYGEGVYEVLRTYNGVPFLYDRHITRLRHSARYLHLDVPFDDDTLRSWVDETADAAALAGDTYIRILLTRGVGELTYDVRATPAPSVVIIVKPPGRRAGPRALRRHPHLARADPAQPSRLGEPDHQVEQPSEQRARDAGRRIAAAARKR